MEIKTTTTHKIKFRIRAFWSEEGGMGEDSFGKEVNELPEALRLLELANASRPDENWMIVCDVDTKTVKN